MVTGGSIYYIFRPQIWSDRIYFFFKKNLQAANIFADYSDQVAAGGRSVLIPHISDAFTVRTIVDTTGEIVTTQMNDTKSDLDISTWNGNAFYITDFQRAQIANNVAVKDGYIEAMAYALAKSLDTSLLALGSGFSRKTGNSTSDLSATNLEDAIKICWSYSIPQNELVMILHPNTYWNGPMQRQKYYDASQFGKATLPYGIHDYLFGIPVIVTANIPAGTSTTEGGHRNFVCSRRAFAFALNNLGGGSNRVSLTEQRGEELRTKVIGSIAYGVKCLDNYAGVRMIATTGEGTT